MMVQTAHAALPCCCSVQIKELLHRLRDAAEADWWAMPSLSNVN